MAKNKAILILSVQEQELILSALLNRRNHLASVELWAMRQEFTEVAKRAREERNKLRLLITRFSDNIKALKPQGESEK